MISMFFSIVDVMLIGYYGNIYNLTIIEYNNIMFKVLEMILI